MRETYGVLGSGSAPRKVIEAGLNDIGVAPMFLVPWYGKVSEGLEVVYDWVLDNEATFMIIAKDGAKSVPKALSSKAESIVTVDDVDLYMVKSLKEREVEGLALVLWDEDKTSYSVKVSSMAIDLRLPTLELTNGLVPIILDEDEKEEELPDIGEASYDKETLEMMPTALVKRMAKDRGFDPKSRDEAVAVLSKTDEPLKEDGEIGSILVMFKNGTELGFTLSQESMKKIMEIVVAECAN